MAGELHEISQAIGRLEAGNAERERQVSAIFREIKDINNKLASLPILAADVEQMQPEVQDWTRTKNRALGAIAFLSCIATFMGAIGAWLAEHAGKIFR